MDINDIRGIITAITMLAFVVLSLFVWRRYRRAEFDESARRPLEDDHYITQDRASHSRENT
ncbi:MAG: cbb3-type cytochrome c oxidase subunit 3 [Gammaproteobacteria bacterium]|jgi:cbb3-type cytochrome oxidase subunit 3|nr:cbb3-type cytochrome c oxidase subunit 3 [Gammaproteobacteria bacterium]MDH3757016.1 cbb3-type cytochrome c oxidase subunit 3 [Gammaproteobacteria bacterium]MDH3846607.1 cbb3-type cytochrome c oxidase subunit 3 [Gammaproteobacteria bacterium]MDH3862510.1 cbb3-type cytochrome c oxidase subunit 3 [Gammaproteobacteria bacterium]MDH3904638.1 cbb3-type cytochrome c oxidase subunit 3 [Gammaproteobacteria bacterium]